MLASDQDRMPAQVKENKDHQVLDTLDAEAGELIFNA